MDYQQHFENIVKSQLERIQDIKNVTEFVDYSAKDKIIIGVISGDGIGPAITAVAEKILKKLLSDDISAGKIQIRAIEGLTIENRLEKGQAVPDDVLEEIKGCDVLLKGPTTTPQMGDNRKNIESANVAIRKALDLFANVRPVKIPEFDIDWVFFRENTECLYAMGNQGIDINDDLAIDFRVITSPGVKRIARLAFEHAKANARDKVSIVTKANVVKTTDGKFLEVCKSVGEEYPDIKVDNWYIDIMTAKLVDIKRRSEFQVMILPNLYGDILTDEAAELNGGVGTAGSANIGMRYAMFEAIHGSAPRMVEEGRAQYADPCSIIRAAAMLLSHIGYQEKSDKLNLALDECTQGEQNIMITGRSNGATSQEFAEYVLAKI
ncbi:MAG: isocitrate/isopropylmalate dehydrogenase family protein [Eggerthellaceae bacterium]|nr:isocitrate/isopropylmalate dehydrogenase family protein [Eggerthellaceae bacterium]